MRPPPVPRNSSRQGDQGDPPLAPLSILWYSADRGKPNREPFCSTGKTIPFPSFPARPVVIRNYLPGEIYNIMIIVISLGALITALIYFFGFIAVLYVIDRIVYSLNELFEILNTSIPYIGSSSIQLFFLFLAGSIVVLVSKNDKKQHKNENNEIIYRKEWQKLLDVINVSMIYPILIFYEKTKTIDAKMKIYMLGYAVLFLIVFVFSHYYAYIKNKYSAFDTFCSYLYKSIVVLAYIFIIALIICIYAFVVYLHDFSVIKNSIASILYYIFLIFSTIFFSFAFFPNTSKNCKIRAIVIDYILLVIFSIVLGFSPFYNLFVKNESIYSIHSLVLIDIILIFLITTISLPAEITTTLRQKEKS
jgi:hypothetical protein